MIVSADPRQGWADVRDTRLALVDSSLKSRPFVQYIRAAAQEGWDNTDLNARYRCRIWISEGYIVDYQQSCRMSALFFRIGRNHFARQKDTYIQLCIHHGVFTFSHLQVLSEHRRHSFPESSAGPHLLPFFVSRTAPLPSKANIFNRTHNSILITVAGQTFINFLP